MNSIVLKTATKFLSALMLIFSIFILLRGHNEPGGGFAGGLVAASAFSLFLFTYGPKAIRKFIPMDFRLFLGAGLLLILISGALGLVLQQSFLTGIWFKSIGTPLLFDIGVYIIVVGAILKIILSLEEKEH